MREITGCVYFIREEGTDFVKIGSSTRSGADRARENSTGNPRNLYVAHEVVVCDFNPCLLEKEFHWFFKEYHIRGEWFSNAEKIVRAVQDARISSPWKSKLTAYQAETMRFSLSCDETGWSRGRLYGIKKRSGILTKEAMRK